MPIFENMLERDEFLAEVLETHDKEMMALFIVVSVIMCFLPEIDVILVLTGILSLIVVGPITLFLGLWSVFRISGGTQVSAESTIAIRGEET